MSHHMTSAVLACFYEGGALRMIAYAVADACPDATGERMYRSVPTLAHMAQVSDRTVQRALGQFVRDGWLIPMDDGTGGRGRSAMYRINPDWITAAAVEVARARVAGVLPSLVRPVAPGVLISGREGAEKGGNLPPFGKPETGPVDNSEKGDNLSPFSAPQKPERVTNPTIKGDKSGLKGDTAMSPEHYEQNTTNTPLPPKTGGEPDFPEFQALESEYPRQDPADRKAAARVWRDISPDARRLEAMRTVLRAQRDSPQWQADAGRWVPKLSRWLRGWLVGDGPALPVVVPPVVVVPLPPPVVLTPEQIEANKARARAAREALGQMLAADRLQGPAKVPATGRAASCN